MKKSAYFSNIFFAFAVTSVGFLCVLRYLRVSLATACLFGVVAGVCAACFTALFLKNKREIGLQKAADEKLKEKFLLHLTLLPVAKRNEYLSSLLECKISDEFLIKDGSALLLPLFRFNEVTADEILPILRQDGYERRQICCDKASAETKKLCEQVGVEIIDGVQLFRLAKEKNALPQAYVSERLFTQKKKERLKLCFAKSNSRRFLIGGVFVLLSSLITPFPYYYLAVGFFLLGIAIFIRIFGEN